MFAKNEFKKYIYVDFKVDNDIRRFIKNNVDADKIIQYLSLVKQIDIDSETLIIFDEVQECMPLLTSLKYFCQNHKEIPIIATGSIYKLKELEYIERICEKVGNININGGSDILGQLTGMISSNKKDIN